MVSFDLGFFFRISIKTTYGYLHRKIEIGICIARQKTTSSNSSQFRRTWFTAAPALVESFQVTKFHQHFLRVFTRFTLT